MEKKEENYAILSNKDKNLLLENFFEKNKNLKETKDFNAWFNDQFEKNKLKNQAEESGYGNWLTSEEDLEPEKRINQSEMASEFQKKKNQVRSLVVHKDVHEIYANNLGASDLTSDAPEEYSSDLFSNLCYQDLKKAHTESVIPVTEEDYHKVQKFKNVNEYMSHRSSQETKPLSEIQALEYLKNRTREGDKEATKRAYDLAKQVEQAKQNNQSFWGHIMKITDK